MVALKAPYKSVWVDVTLMVMSTNYAATPLSSSILQREGRECGRLVAVIAGPRAVTYNHPVIRQQ